VTTEAPLSLDLSVRRCSQNLFSVFKELYIARLLGHTADTCRGQGDLAASLSDERTGLSSVRLTDSSNMSIVSVCIMSTVHMVQQCSRS
jgi:hypothetical protein